MDSGAIDISFNTLSSAIRAGRRGFEHPLDSSRLVSMWIHALTLMALRALLDMSSRSRPFSTVRAVPPSERRRRNLLPHFYFMDLETNLAYSLAMGLLVEKVEA